MQQTNDIHRQRAAAIALADTLKIPASLYEQAVARYEAIADHLEREGGAVAHLRPRIYSQGSFRLGTVVRPINKDEGYDLDLACELRSLDKSELTQEQLKKVIGAEVAGYAQLHEMQKPEEKPRCWHLDYRDDVAFHIDIVPALPEDDATKSQLRTRVRPEWVRFVDTAVAITDWDDHGYTSRTGDWPKSNPAGYADWFTGQAARRFAGPVELREAEQIPSYEWNSPLQTVVQILKRHRDVMFEDDMADAPISIIITTLAALAYDGEQDLRDALVGIADRLPSFVGVTNPQVENPVNPEENFADKWAPDQKPKRRDAYERWRKQVREDVAELGRYGTKSDAGRHFDRAFRAPLQANVAGSLVPAAAAATPHFPLRHEPRPWADIG